MDIRKAEEKLYCADCDTLVSDADSVMIFEAGHAGCLPGDPYVEIRFRLCDKCVQARIAHLASLAQQL